MEYTGKNIIIAGAGKSGIAAAGLLAGESDKIVLYDENVNINPEELKEKLPEEFKGEIILGELPEEAINAADLLVISPGVPTDLEFVQKLKARGVTIWGEAELGFRYAKGRLAAITGTNGKTTTTALLGEIMKSQYESVFVVGNIGIPYTCMVHEMNAESVTVAEMSSFQLESVDAFHPQVSMILNITPDHLNRHHTMENYAMAKANIMMNQSEDETCVLNYEDERLRELAKLSKAKVVWFSSVRELEEGLFVKNENIVYRNNGEETVICSIHDMNIIGRHNHENAMAAIAGAMAMGVTLENIRKTLKTFVAVEHRIEYTATKNGVKYYNDSKGTNPDASIQAVRAMSTPIILIGGGYDKGSEYEEWIESFEGKVKYLVLMGQTAGKIAETAEKMGFKDYVFVNSMEEAVNFSYEHALPGDAVLLSPCCASWGMFKDYEERGRIFKELVRSLPDSK
ncbi:MAG: UDP-N-acetylmuramoyl-L-alanine--D-glutamate ligase [Lachnospiraceae bacterium]|nr:UDP-N-acetylmuramoyl-L-alanine--D-glutamate ligase [Lachnospiraceae bacterium]